MKTSTEFREIKKKDFQMYEHAIDFGAMLLCKSGRAELQINFGPKGDCPWQADAAA